MTQLITQLITWILIGGGGVVSIALAGHQGHEGHEPSEIVGEIQSEGRVVPGASFQVYLRNIQDADNHKTVAPADAEAALHTVVKAFEILIHQRTHYPRFNETLSQQFLQAVILEPKVINREGKEFTFLVARTAVPGKVRLLISVSAMKRKGYLNQPDTLAPVLAREFQWVVSKAETKPKPRQVLIRRDLAHAPIQRNAEIFRMSGEERNRILQELFQTYLTTVDDFHSLEGQPYYELGKTTLITPVQPDSTTKLYDIRVREALQLIVREPYFQEQTPKAVRSLLNGKIWNVAFVKIDRRDWATRTRVLPKDKAIRVGTGKKQKTIQPAKILVNYHRTASPEDPFFPVTDGLPMGALTPQQLARVIALEIEQNIVEKSMRGHVAQDELTAPE